jgi:hypothetical protein
MLMLAVNRVDELAKDDFARCESDALHAFGELVKAYENLFPARINERRDRHPE